jgi:hypothetical protein
LAYKKQGRETLEKTHLFTPIPIDISLILTVYHSWGSKVARGALLEGAGA